jgi:hypothetical protein
MESLMRRTGPHLNLSVQDCFDSGTPGIQFYDGQQFSRWLIKGR